MNLLKVLRCYFYLKFYKFLYKHNSSQKVEEKLNHYKRKYEILSTKTVTYKEFRNYIKRRERYDITDVEELAKPLPFHVKSNELWGWNDFYGCGEIYKKYAGYPIDYKLKFVIDHAIYFWENHFNKEEYAVNLPAHIVTSEFALEKFKNKTDKYLFPAGIHMFYVDNYYDIERFKAEKEKLGKNLLVFPSHSSDVVIAKWNEKPLIDEILRIKKLGNFNTVTICFYYADIQRGFHKKFEGYGFNFVTAGHILDTNFISRLKTIIKLSDVTMSNSIGSHTFYSIGNDKPHYLIPEKNFKYISTANEQQGNTQEEYEKTLLKDNSLKYYEKVFGEYRENLSDEQIKLRDKICGFNSKRTKEEMKAFFEKTEEMYKKKNIKQNKKPYIHIFTLMLYLKNEGEKCQ